ncbi:ATP-binding response regulator [Variovorax terrae]|uniref:histidine kinase n=1 Tax=Variovorax terrae TaxID=2923278 RepID=A0A9X2AM99_9BURK|nr:hybrid sensor histidine kinase/response regulator [Variovorax terrae]MCJ0763099.1 hybrid sensor histidine kinase/response regulator [Variovorax terrae]
MCKPWRLPEAWGPVLREDRVLREQVLLVERNLGIGMFGSLAGGLLCVGALWNTLSTQFLLGWLLLYLGLIVAGRVLLLRRGGTARMAPRAGLRVIVAHMAMVGALWGLLSVWTWQHAMDQPWPVFAMLAIMAGVSAGAMAFTAPCVPAYWAYAFSALLPLAWNLLAHGGPQYVAIGLGSLVFLAVTCLFARNIDLDAARGIELRFENLQLLERAEAAQARAEQANRDKSRFLAAASHDLRQPLHAMGLFLEALVRTPLTPHQQTVLTHAQSASDAAGEMLTTLLDYSRLEAGVIRSQPKTFAVQPLLLKLEQEFGAQADAQGLVYRTRETQALALADRALVDLVLHNLISNAIRYTHQGGILVACRARSGMLALEVWDTGIGIAPDQQQDIFKEFHQLGNPERDRRKGLGLGLAIVQRLAREMGTRVELLSRPQRGSVFRFWLPASHGSVLDDQDRAAPEANLQGLRVLVIDDDDSVRLAMHALLGGWGCHCATADSLEQAWPLIEAQAPQLLITDYRLRENRTGAQVVTAVRARLGAGLPAIIITGDTAPQRLREAQHSDALLLHKPVSARLLHQAIAKLVG